MTRKEEILKQAIKEQSELYQPPEYRTGFIDGATWADETMIKKACEWIEQYLFDLGYPDDWCRDSPNIESGKERFIKAMNEE